MVEKHCFKSLFSCRHGRPVGNGVLFFATTTDRGHLALNLSPNQPVGHHADRQLRADGVALDDVEAALLLQKLSRA
jgi:hypothetical protein